MAITWITPYTVTATGTGQGFLDVDCSVATGYVSGSHANGVAMCRYVGSNNADVGVRLNGDTTIPALHRITDLDYAYFYCPLDGSGIFEAANNYGDNYDWEVLGFIDASDVHLFSAMEETELSGSTFANITPTPSGDDTVYAAFGYASAATAAARPGTRPDGSSESFQSVCRFPGGFIVPCVAGIFEGYGLSGYSTFYHVLGYIKNGTDYTWNTSTYTNLQTATAATWHEDLVVNASATSAFIYTYESLSATDCEVAIRKAGTAGATTYESDARLHMGIPVECDSSGRIDVYSELADTTFRVIGYETASTGTTDVNYGATGRGIMRGVARKVG